MLYFFNIKTYNMILIISQSKIHSNNKPDNTKICNFALLLTSYNKELIIAL